MTSCRTRTARQHHPPAEPLRGRLGRGAGRRGVVESIVARRWLLRLGRRRACDPLAERSQAIREILDRISNAGCQVIGAVCLSCFCERFGIAHPDIDSLIAHLWAFARIASPDEFVAWDRALGRNALHGLGDPVPDEVLAVVPAELQEDFGALVESVVEIGMYDAYGANTDGPRDFLMLAIRLCEGHNVPVPNLEPFLRSPQTSRWGMPVAEETLAQWRLLANR